MKFFNFLNFFSRIVCGVSSKRKNSYSNADFDWMPFSFKVSRIFLNTPLGQTESSNNSAKKRGVFSSKGITLPDSGTIDALASGKPVCHPVTSSSSDVLLNSYNSSLLSHPNITSQNPKPFFEDLINLSTCMYLPRRIPSISVIATLTYSVLDDSKYFLMFSADFNFLIFII